MLAWQHSWFSSYLQGDDGRLGLLLLSLDIISSLKLQAEIIRALMRGSQKEPGNCIPQQQRWYLPSMLPSPALWGGQWGMLRQTGSASQLLETCPDPAGQGQGCLPGQLQHCSLQHAHRTRFHMLPGPGSDLGHGQSWAACALLACMLEQTKGSMAPVASFQPALPLWGTFPVLRVLWESSERPMLPVWPYLCHKHQSKAQASIPSALQFPSLSHIPYLILQHLLTKVSL